MSRIAGYQIYAVLIDNTKSPLSLGSTTKSSWQYTKHQSKSFRFEFTELFMNEFTEVFTELFMF